jgi:hypothetical protein
LSSLLFITATNFEHFHKAHILPTINPILKDEEYLINRIIIDYRASQVA